MRGFFASRNMGCGRLCLLSGQLFRSDGYLAMPAPAWGGAATLERDETGEPHSSTLLAE